MGSASLIAGKHDRTFFTRAMRPFVLMSPFSLLIEIFVVPYQDVDCNLD